MFSCGKIGHFASHCPYAKNVDNANESSSKKFRNNEKKFNKKNFLSKDYDSSNESDNASDDDSDSESDSDNGSKKLLFMAMSSTGAPESIAYNSKDEGEVYLEGKLIKKLGRSIRHSKKKSKNW